MSTPHRYHYAGIEIASWMPLPELDAGGSAAADVQIVRTSVPRPAGGQTPFGYFAPLPDGIVLEIPACARFAITGGNTIAMEVLGDADANLIRLYLLGSGLGALLHQRGLLPLHAGGIGIAEGAFALVGESGAGKSTLTALLATAGAAYLADDVCPVTATISGPVIWPGVRRVRLSPAACRSLALPETAGDADPFGKRMLDPPWRRPGEPLPLRGLVILSTDAALGSARLTRAAPREVLSALVAHTYRPAFLAPARRGGHLATCAALAAQVDGWHLARPWDLERAPEDARKLLHELAAATAGSAHADD